MTFRLIDDLLSIANPIIEDYLALPYPMGIYPEALTLKRTNAALNEADFAGLLLREVGETVVTSLYDKRREFPFPVVRNQHPDSTLPPSVLYGVYTSQLHRYATACTLVEDFRKEAFDLLDYLVGKGYSHRRLMKRLVGFAKDHGVRKYRLSTASITRRLPPC